MQDAVAKRFFNDSFPDLFETSEGCIVYCEQERTHWVVAKTKADGTVDYWKLSDSDKKKFDVKRYAEIEKLLEMNAYRLLSVRDSMEFRKRFPEYVLPSRFVDRWKGQDDLSLIHI